MAGGRRTGSADLPLHGGHVPPWLAERMTRLGRLIAETIIHHYGRDEFLRRLAHPFWFQSFGAVMGMDWHSSGITTSVMGSLKRGLAPLQDELGLFVCGGRGRHSRRTPAELALVGDRTGLDGHALARTSRLTAKIDSAAVQDGFELYLHSFVVADDGRWVVVQQGMNGERGQARRYHWLSEGLTSFVDEPHSAIEGAPQGNILNLTDRRARRSRDGQVCLVQGDPDHVIGTLRTIRDGGSIEVYAPEEPAMPPHLRMPSHHDVRPTDVFLRRLRGTLAAASEAGPAGYEDLLLTPGMGARSVAALALVSEVVHGAPARFEDPARFSFAHGGKDGHPYPVPLKVYDETIATLKHALAMSKLGSEEKLTAIRRLDEQARALENRLGGPTFEDVVAAEKAATEELSGATVFTHSRSGRARKAVRTKDRQLRLF
jgi:hypothetical protein